MSVLLRWLYQVVLSALSVSSLQDGAFLIRHSSAQNSRQPYTLAVLYQEKVYNIPIRFLEETQGYALGKEGKKSEEVRANEAASGEGSERDRKEMEKKKRKRTGLQEGMQLRKNSRLFICSPHSISFSLPQMFTTLDEMISHHRNNQLLLIDSKSQAKHTAYLTHPARP